MPDKETVIPYQPMSKVNDFVKGIEDLIKGLCDGSIPAPWGNKKCPKIDVDYEGSDVVPEQEDDLFGNPMPFNRNTNFSGKDMITKSKTLINKINNLDKNCK